MNRLPEACRCTRVISTIWASDKWHLCWRPRSVLWEICSVCHTFVWVPTSFGGPSTFTLLALGDHSLTPHSVLSNTSLEKKKTATAHFRAAVFTKNNFQLSFRRFYLSNKTFSQFSGVSLQEWVCQTQNPLRTVLRTQKINVWVLNSTIEACENNWARQTTRSTIYKPIIECRFILIVKRSNENWDQMDIAYNFHSYRLIEGKLLIQGYNWHPFLEIISS